MQYQCLGLKFNVITFLKNSYWTKRYTLHKVFIFYDIQQKPINPAHLEPDRCQFIKYTVLLGGTYTEQSSYRQLFITAPLFWIYNYSE